MELGWMRCVKCVWILILLEQTSTTEPEICISFIESESTDYDFTLRCNFTNAPDITSITWSFPNDTEADRLQINTTLRYNADDSHLTELSVSNFNDSTDEGEYICIGAGTGDILFGGSFLLNACEDISLDPAFEKLDKLVDEEMTPENAETAMSIAIELYEHYDSSEFHQDAIDVFVDAIEFVSLVNFTERNQTIDILTPYLEVSSETLSFNQLKEEDFATIVLSVENAFVNAVDVLDEVDDTVVISSPKAETEAYIGVRNIKDTTTQDSIDLGLDEFSRHNEGGGKQNTLSIDISNVEENSTLKFVVLLYSGGYAKNQNYTHFEENDDGEKVATKPISDILTIRLIQDEEVISVPVNFTLNHHIGKIEFSKNKSIEQEIETSITFECSYLDERKKATSLWNSFGCVTSTIKQIRSNCFCNHTTSFAVLMKVTENDFKIPEDHQTALSWIMYIGCGVSLVALLLALATFTYVGLTDRIKIHVCLCATLLIAESFMLFGIKLTEPPILCTAIAIILHFSFLSVFAWMLVEGIHMYVMIIRVFGSENINFNYYFIVGWATPIVVVGASVGANLDGYGNENSCWLDVESGLIWAFVGPALLVILINLIILILVVRIIKRATNVSDDDIAKAKATMKGIVVLLPILGVTWVFGLFAIGSATLVFQYIFSLLNSLQGLFIFIFYCLMNSEVRSSFERKRKQHQLATGDLSTLDESRSGKTSKQSKVKAVSNAQLQNTGDNKDVISVTVSKSRAGTPNLADEGIDMNMPGGVDEDNFE